MQRSAVTEQMLDLICFPNAHHIGDHLAQFLITCQRGAAGVGVLTTKVGGYSVLWENWNGPSDSWVFPEESFYEPGCFPYLEKDSNH